MADIASDTHPGPLLALWRTVTRFDRGSIAPRMGLRNTLGVVLPLAIGAALGGTGAGLVASTGALNVSFSDGEDPYRHRARRMLAASLLVGFSVLVGCICGRDRPLIGTVTVLWSFAAALLVAVGGPAADLAIVSVVTLVVFSAQALPPAQALSTSLVALAGGLFQTALALVFWPVRRYAPERRALGDLFRKLADTAAHPATVAEAPLGTLETTRAQETLAALSRDHSLPGERYLFLLSQAERIRLSLLALARMRKRIEREDPAHWSGSLLDRPLAICSTLLNTIADWLLKGRRPGPAVAELEQLQQIAEQLRATGERPAEGSSAPMLAALIEDAASQMDALAGQLRSAMEVANQTTPEGLADFERHEARQPWTMRFGGAIATLRANLTFRSASFRHAVRLAASILASEVLGSMLGWPRSYWMPMTIAIVLKPDFSSTFSRGVLRLAGTFAGLLLATALFHLTTPGPKLEIALIAAMVFALRCFGAANYGILVAAVSALVVLLIAMTGVDPRNTISARAWNTGAAGLLALLAYALWPTWERTQVSEALAHMLDAYFRYFQAVAGAYLKAERASAGNLDRARMGARLARSNAEASADRVAAEPGATAQRRALLAAMLASSHRLVHTVMALEAGLSSSRPVPTRDRFRVYAHSVELTLHSLAAALRGSPLSPADLPDLREIQRALVRSGDGLSERHALVNVETDRLTNALNTLAGQIFEWVAGGEWMGGGFAR